jgi:hypothetical protein
MAIGKPVLCLTDGGGTETMLKRLGAGEFCGRLNDRAGITSILLRLLDETPAPPVPLEQLMPYDRAQIARTFATALEHVVKGTLPNS